jgi:anthranilate synthase component 2
MILLIDNYDSFTYNLFHYLISAGAKEVLVKRNDKISLEEINILKPEAIVLSPGPCSPNEAGICLDIIKNFKGKLPIFGVCLGHQAIGEAFGGKVIRAQKVMHGKTDSIHHTGVGVFKNLPDPFNVTRYHSLAIEKSSLPACLEVTATSSDGEIMGVRHKELAVEGVQFHPESILSEHGHALLKNFLQNK